MHRLSKVGLDGARGGAAAPWAGPLATAFLWWVGGWAWMAPTMVFWPKCGVWMGLLLFCLNAPFWLRLFVTFSRVALQNMFIPKLLENVSYKP